MVFLVKTEPLDQWAQEGLLVKEDGQDFLELQGLEVTMVPEVATDNQAHLVLLEQQDSLDPLVLRVKLDLQGPLVQMAPLDKEESLDRRDMLVLKVLLALLGTMVVLAAKVKWVLPAFLELLGSWEPGVLLDHLVLTVFLASEVLLVNPVRTVPKESQGHVVNVVKLVLQVFQGLKEKMAKMAHLENLAPMDFRELREKGVPLDSEDLLDQVALQEKRVLLGSVVVQAPLGPEERLENLAEMVPLEVQE